MRIFRALAIALTFSLAACGEHDHESYATLQACYDEHHNVESLPIRESIVVCCLEHPIDGVSPSCDDTAAACVQHVDAELDATVSSSEIQAACTDYIVQLEAMVTSSESQAVCTECIAEL